MSQDTSQLPMARAASLVLEDGRAFHGFRFGAARDGAGEVVFNTAHSGYQEILTDPSYAGQLVVMTYPMIGNYGINPEDMESRRVFAAGLVVREPSRIVSNWRANQSLDDYLDAQGVPGLWGIDTRALVRHLREHGSMRGIIADPADTGALQQRALAHPTMAGLDLASTVTTKQRYRWDRPSVLLHKTVPTPPAKHHVVAIDFGVKHNMLRRLVDEGCEVTVVPANSTPKEILALEPHGLLLSNGPGDPEPVAYAVETVKALLGKIPIFGICLGHQILGLALGAKSYKLPFGHHGANHPVQDLRTRKVEITSQNHGFALDEASLPPGRAEVTHRSLNDGTVEGIRVLDAPAFSVQYHPEAAPGPHDAGNLFAQFVELMEAHCAKA